jgi:hypothetical protein
MHGEASYADDSGSWTPLFIAIAVVIIIWLLLGGESQQREAEAGVAGGSIKASGGPPRRPLSSPTLTVMRNLGIPSSKSCRVTLSLNLVSPACWLASPPSTAVDF